ncbi:MAG: hypothetical protein AB7D28_01550 [Candidatus Berkiella sp.]
MKKYIGFSLVLFLSSTFQAQAVYLSPHMGVDWKYWGASLNNDLPRPLDHVFPDISSGMSFYLGTRINGFFGIDFGYDQSISKEKSHVFNGNETFLKPTVEPLGNASTVDIRFKAFHLNSMFYWPVMKDVEILGLLGISRLEPDVHMFYLTGGQRLEISQNAKTKYSARIGLGTQYNPWWFLGFRGMVIWDQTKRVNILGVDETSVPFDISPYKSATSFHLGVVFTMADPRNV